MNKAFIKNSIELMRLHKPVGILLLLWPTLWALWLAGDGKPHVWNVVVFVLGVIVMRSLGCVVNDIADRHIDPFVERTRNRPLASQKMSVKTAWMIVGVLMSVAFLLVLLLNRFTLYLACVGAVFAFIYPLLKRITYWPQCGLGVAFAWSVPMAFSAEINTLPRTMWVLFLAVLVWPLMYDTLYAMVDREDDQKIGVKSTAILFGTRDRLVIVLLQCVFLALLTACGYLFELNGYYFISLVIVMGFFIYQYRLIKTRDRNAYFRAFLNNQWVGMIIFLGILASFYV